MYSHTYGQYTDLCRYWTGILNTWTTSLYSFRTFLTCFSSIHCLFEVLPCSLILPWWRWRKGGGGSKFGKTESDGRTKGGCYSFGIKWEAISISKKGVEFRLKVRDMFVNTTIYRGICVGGWRGKWLRRGIWAFNFAVRKATLTSINKTDTNKLEASYKYELTEVANTHKYCCQTYNL